MLHLWQIFKTKLNHNLERRFYIVSYEPFDHWQLLKELQSVNPSKVDGINGLVVSRQHQNLRILTVLAGRTRMNQKRLRIVQFNLFKLIVAVDEHIFWQFELGPAQSLDRRCSGSHMLR